MKITPPTPFWMSGYAARTHPSEGVEQELWAKALALRDARGPPGGPRHHRPHRPAARDLRRGGGAGPGAASASSARRLVLSASHTHCGPAVRKNLAVLYDFGEEDRRRVDAYGAALADRLVEVVGGALEDLAPARLSVGHGSVGFAVNRREPTPEGVKIGVNPAGPVDHDVPVLRVAAHGRLAPRRALRLRLPQHDPGRRLLPDRRRLRRVRPGRAGEGPPRGDRALRDALRRRPEPEPPRDARPGAPARAGPGRRGRPRAGHGSAPGAPPDPHRPRGRSRSTSPPTRARCSRRRRRARTSSASAGRG